MGSSSDDWCFVDSETGSVRSPSFDAVEPELELEPMYVEEPIVLPKATVVLQELGKDDEGEDDVDVASLLEDHSMKPTRCSRDVRVSLLSPVHQRYVVTRKVAPPKPVVRRRYVREAFTTPSRRIHSGSNYVARLRAAMPSPRSGCPPILNTAEEMPVKPFTRDQAVQTDDHHDDSKLDRLSALSSALDRSLRLSMQLKAKAHDAERLDVRGILLHSQCDDFQQENETLVKQLRDAKRGLRIAGRRGELAEEYQDHMKRDLQQLRLENGELHQRIEVLSGGLNVETKSIGALEQLEDDLAKAMAKIRGALRSKYRAAMSGELPPSIDASKASDDSCVVCMEKFACVRFEPCGHEVLCAECSLRVAECPVDRQPIQDKVLTHGLNAYNAYTTDDSE